MKRGLLLLVVALALLATIPAAGPVLAKESSRVAFTATLTVDQIGPGTVKPVGDYPNGRFMWQVKDRPVSGTITGNVFNGTYSYVYSGLLKPDQSGQVKGKMTITTAGGTARGEVAPTQVSAPQPIGVIIMIEQINGQPTPVPHVLLKVTFSQTRVAINSGTGAFDDVEGKGTLSGEVYPILDSTRTHVIGLANGTAPAFDFTGQPLGMPASKMVMTGHIAKH